MYPSDYSYAAGNSCLSTPVYDYRGSDCANNNYLLPTYYELTQTPYSDNSESISIISFGSMYYPSFYIELPEPARPVLYLTSKTPITGGNGTKTSPFTLT